jgi:hypothetical protein
MSHELSAGHDWTRPVLPWAKRQEYDTPARTAEDLHAEVAASWERWYRGRDTEWLTACAEAGSPDTPHGLLVRRILAERS